VKPLGQPGPPDALGGLAMDPQGRLYITPGGANGTLDTIDPQTGAIREGPRLTGAPYPGAITALTFTPSGLLLGVNSNIGSPAATKLVQINTATGAMTSIGVLPDDSDALTFGQPKRDVGEILRTLGGRTLAVGVEAGARVVVLLHRGHGTVQRGDRGAIGAGRCRVVEPRVPGELRDEPGRRRGRAGGPAGGQNVVVRRAR